jgi:hypothetical protein
MPSAPTTAITHPNPRLDLTYGQAKLCRPEAAGLRKERFPQDHPPQKSPSRPESLSQARERKPVNLDFPIEPGKLPPRLG